MSRFFAVCFAMLFAVAMVGVAAPGAANAASCVRFSTTHFDATGNDNTNRNGEWVRIKNYCSAAKLLSSWTISDYGTKNTYAFKSGLKIGAGVSITLYTGSGTNTSTRRYWAKSTQVWDNTSTERAYLKNASGALQSKASGSTSGGGSGGSGIASNCDPNYSGFCVPNVGYDLNCPDIAHMVIVVGYDKHGFDRDNDGYGCESYG
jgi:hypothetical protein